MLIDKDTVHIGKISQDTHLNILNVLGKLTKEDWLKWSLRQDKFAVHKYTKSIPVTFHNLYSLNRWYIDDFKDHQFYKDLFYKEFSLIDQYLGKETVITSFVFARMDGPSSIPHHVDKHFYFSQIHRIHICLSADTERLSLKVNGVHQDISVGDIFELNNLRPHGVDYLGAEPRIHAVIDLLPKELEEEFIISRRDVLEED